ncbi:MAG TPA: HVO_0476 family zinc finger protein [Methanomassiliicoccales archaeon]|nr:HVO_0476 family zinc finger protein [Methanomassiliicoccales archaeon]
MTVPNALHLDCQSCEGKTVHEVLRGRLSKGQDVIEATVRCQECGTVSNVVVREPKTVTLQVILSDMGASKRESIELNEDDEVAIEDELFVGDLPVMVTGIEVDGRRLVHAPASKIQCLWVKRFDKVRVKVSINKVHKTLSVDMEALPEEEFFIGDMMNVGREQVVIHYIKTKDGMVKRGSVLARDIVRIYTKAARITYS